MTFTADSDELVTVLPSLAALRVRGLTVTPPSLEELFLRHYGDLSADVARKTRRAARHSRVGK